ncbi:mitotic apparatus protein p62-like protein [Colletotrichum musicola]|uniref:Mitotic apparatus protein p62-like protein n=1 Tax=Colletotrichum musicola TaxID=2175873 RepID=A0A8H6U7C5_9PEZI|nr:mitotic apparatus protein p62-like protein [Colletotrichum musicola]
MASGRVLRFPRSDKDGAFVIVQTTPTRSKALDVKLVATDGVEPYAISLRHDKIGSLLGEGSPLSDDEWLRIMTAVVQQEPIDGVEVIASLEDESTMILTIRQKGGEFMQRLGAIELSHSPREVIELYEWCGMSAQTANGAKEALASATAKASRLEDTVRELKAQLEELTAAKQSDETELLEKFCDLLNEKKLKIRQQQRLLASVSADPGRRASPPVKQEPLTQEPTLRDAARAGAKAAGKSRAGKRKVAPAPVDDDDSDDGFEKMDVDEPKESAQVDSDQQTTDDEDETASEDDDDEPAAVPPAKRAPVKETPQVKGPAKPPPKEAPPPKRALPFGRKKQEAPKAPPPPEGSETESDDEL